MIIAGLFSLNNSSPFFNSRNHQHDVQNSMSTIAEFI